MLYLYPGSVHLVYGGVSAKAPYQALYHFMRLTSSVMFKALCFATDKQFEDIKVTKLRSGGFVVVEVVAEYVSIVLFELASQQTFHR